MKPSIVCRCLAGLIVLAACVVAEGVPPPGTAFTYQGELKQSGSPFTGTVPMTFRLFAQASGGTALGTLALPAVSVQGGLVNASLDFGVSPFAEPDQRWLEVEVSGQVMLPRTLLTPAPFSLTTRGISVDGNGNVGIGQGATASWRLAVDGGMSVYDSPRQGVGIFSDLIRMGSVSSEDTAYQYDGSSDTHTFSTAGSARMVIDSLGRVGIGTESPTALLEVSGPVGDGTVKLPDSSISAAECLDEPGVAFTSTTVNSLSTLPADGVGVSVGSQTINCPTNGYVLAIGSAFLTMGVEIKMNLRLDSESIDWLASEGFDNPSAGVSSNQGTRFVHRVIPVTQGPHTVSLVAVKTNPTANDFAGRVRISLLFVPTAYGSVNPLP